MNSLDSKLYPVTRCMHQVLVMREIKYLLFFFPCFLPHLLSLRGIFRLLAQYQLENKDNPSYPGTYGPFPHLFGVEWWCCKLSHGGTGFGYAGYIISNRRAVTVGSVSLSGIDYLSSGAESYSKRKLIEWLDPKDLLLLLSTFKFRHYLRQFREDWS